MAKILSVARDPRDPGDYAIIYEGLGRRHRLSLSAAGLRLLRQSPEIRAALRNLAGTQGDTAQEDTSTWVDGLLRQLAPLPVPPRLEHAVAHRAPEHGRVAAQRPPSESSPGLLRGLLKRASARRERRLAQPRLRGIVTTGLDSSSCR